MKRNAFFQLVQKDDGVYLKSYPALDGGNPLSMDDIMKYFEQKKIMDVQLGDISDFVSEAAKKKNAEKKILSGSRLPENEYPVITVDSLKQFARSVCIRHPIREADSLIRKLLTGLNRMASDMVY